MGRRKEENKKNKVKFIIAGIVIVVLIVIAIVIGIVLNKNNDKNEVEKEVINMNAEAVVYYQTNNSAEITLKEDGQVFATNLTITWVDGCTGVIKKDGKELSTQKGTTLFEDGDYEISVTSPKNVTVTRKLTMDKTPPEVEIKENSDSTCTILFKNINDIDTAILYKFDDKAEKFVQLSDLKAEGLQEKMEMKENGFYLLECADKLQNINSQRFEVEK